MEMRQKDLAVTEDQKIDDIILRCNAIRLAFADGSHPYIVPVSFGYQRTGGEQRFYFHSAPVGRKVSLCRSLGYAGFELDLGEIVPGPIACRFTMKYESVIGEGIITELRGAVEKNRAMESIMEHYTGKADWDLPQQNLDKTCMFCLTVRELTARTHG